MSFEAATRTLKAAADPTRLRLLALLAHGEAAVGELQAILGQSQPRVSRHLRILTDAGLVERFRDGHWIYYRLTTEPVARRLVRAAIDQIGPSDVVFEQDRCALDQVKHERQRAAFGHGAGAPAFLPVNLAVRPTGAELAEVLEEQLGERRYQHVLEVGCGGGALLPVLASRARMVTAVDSSQAARVLARSRAHEWRLANCTVRDGSLDELPFDDSCFDLVVLDEVLSTAQDPAAGLHETLRVLRAGGQLLILDRIRPVASRLPDASSDGTLIENALTALLVGAGLRLTTRQWLPGRAMEYALFGCVADYPGTRTGTDD
ncbi:MAG TPA: metalloregulator ArsR/SmtB family transcription factor [Chromatiales bacterium]|nr:metalloregulator ArsR/SmtB family transcription factor [Chromatiales bacterium]